LLILPFQWNITKYFLKNINLAKEYLEDILEIEEDNDGEDYGYEDAVDIEEDDDEE
jgi:hypothetical protein